MKLFLDDERMPASREDLADWVICRSSAEAIDYVKNNGWPTFISFDHDLGGEDTSMKFIEWLTTRVLDEGHLTLPFDFYVHSQNPIGAENIRHKLRCLDVFIGQ